MRLVFSKKRNGFWRKKLSNLFLGDDLKVFGRCVFLYSWFLFLPVVPRSCNSVESLPHPSPPPPVLPQIKTVLLREQLFNLWFTKKCTQKDYWLNLIYLDSKLILILIMEILMEGIRSSNKTGQGHGHKHTTVTTHKQATPRQVTPWAPNNPWISYVIHL